MKNRDARIGFFFALFALIPCVGLPLGSAAVVFGIRGLREVEGRTRAWFAIIAGGTFALINLVVLLFDLFGDSLTSS